MMVTLSADLFPDLSQYFVYILLALLWTCTSCFLIGWVIPDTEVDKTQKKKKFLQHHSVLEQLIHVYQQQQSDGTFDRKAARKEIHLKGSLLAEWSAPQKNYLSAYRASVMLGTCIAILAVDLPIFPRRFAKCESFGTSMVRPRALLESQIRRWIWVWAPSCSCTVWRTGSDAEIP